MRENLVMTSLYGPDLCPYVSLVDMSLSPSNREFCLLLFQKALDWLGEGTDLTPSTKWLACAYYAMVFNKTKVFLLIIILRWKVAPQKTINGKRNFKKSLSFPSVDKGNLFLRNCSSRN